MMSSGDWRIRCGIGAGWLLLVLVAASGCGRQTGLTITSYKDPSSPERVQLHPEYCAYRVDSTGDLHIVAGPQPVYRNGSGEAVAGEARSAVAAAGEIVEYLHVHVYWKPHPGKTPAETTTTDATLHYVIASETGSAEYLGTGFVYPKQRRDGRLDVALESGRLRLESYTGDMGDPLGNSRISGRLIAAENATAVSSMLRTMQYVGAQ